VARFGCWGAQIGRVFFAYDWVLWECLGEDGVDDGLGRVVGHFFEERTQRRRETESMRQAPTSFDPGVPVGVFLRRTGYGAFVALDERLSRDELVKDGCG
jgi:hypothetical protein